MQNALRVASCRPGGVSADSFGSACFGADGSSYVCLSLEPQVCSEHCCNNFPLWNWPQRIRIILYSETEAKYRKSERTLRWKCDWSCFSKCTSSRFYGYSPWGCKELDAVEWLSMRACKMMFIPFVIKRILHFYRLNSVFFRRYSIGVLIPSTLECDLIWREGFTDVPKLNWGHQGWALIQYDCCPYRKGKFGYRGKTMWGHREKVVVCKPRREPSGEATLPTPLSQTSSLQNSGRMEVCSWNAPVCGALSRQLELTHTDTSALTCRLIKYCFLLIFFSEDLHRNSTDRNVPLLMDTSVTEPITTWGGSELDWPHDWLVLQLGVRVTSPAWAWSGSLCVSVSWLRRVLWHQRASPFPGKLAVWDCFPGRCFGQPRVASWAPLWDQPCVQAWMSLVSYPSVPFPFLQLFAWLLREALMGVSGSSEERGVGCWGPKMSGNHPNLCFPWGSLCNDKNKI